MKTPIVRFAPSPTGNLHIGNARSALVNYLYAKHNLGRFVLRFDDTDLERSTVEFADGILVDLGWLGIRPDLIVRQSERFPLYDAAAAKLKAAGRLYPCFETPEELDRRRKLQISRGQPPIYDRAALRLSDSDRAALMAAGRRPHWRFLLESRVVHWDDKARGPSHIDCGSLSDPVLVREDGSYLYTFTSVVDDIDLGITLVIRGEDHITNTAVQIQIFEALAGPDHVPAFGHHNLLTSASGEGLSKRHSALSLAALREAGIEPLAVAALAVLTGSSESVHPVTSLDELAGMVDLANMSRTAARFDEAELANLSARTLHGLPFEAVRARLAAMSIDGPAAEPFWLAVRGNLARFSEALEWWDIIEGDIDASPPAEEVDFLRVAAETLPAEPWDQSTFPAWANALRAATGRKGRTLFHPLRVALTGREQGPELAPLLPLIGRLRVLDRLSVPAF